ncbi:flagellar basal body-associated FliL family protein [Clostridium sp. YIM B02515]|uniref:Flagellar protein FliL n=1 Tax=Clostridium rhizosphaerae TaxID=2803861 RepID=A0ABS1TF58_9CLOT|nr:flagellar basal body-associated FliL family protein [Clostridium rhizosphaerae]MBL4937985.1 flagellar basal body-associated FliL family protein [Clostridium rhizosphaerae]
MAEKKEKKGKEKGKGSLFKISIIVLLVLVVLGLGFTGYLLLTNKNAAAAETTQKTQTTNNLNSMEAINALNQISSSTYSMEEFLVNLADEGGKRYFKVKLTLGYEPTKKKEKEMAAEFDTKKPVLRDAINNILRSKKTTDLTTQKNIDDLKKEILTKINPYFENGRINNIYLTDILIQ